VLTSVEAAATMMENLRKEKWSFHLCQPTASRKERMRQTGNIYVAQKQQHREKGWKDRNWCEVETKKKARTAAVV